MLHITASGVGVTLSLSRPQPAAEVGLTLRISEEPLDDRWDEFVAARPEGHHVQTSAWARVKSHQGGRGVRVVLERGGRTVAGAQLLFRPTPVGGRVAYIARGPLVDGGDDLYQRVIEEAVSQARRCKAVGLIVQPAGDVPALEAALARLGFQETGIEVAPAATTVLDLLPDEEGLLAAMKSKTRYNIRKGLRKGVRVDRADLGDLSSFHELLNKTGERQGFTVPEISYFETLVEELPPTCEVAVFVAYVDDDPVSTLLAIGFGDLVTYKRGAWSGRHSSHHPNEVMHWTTVQWAKAAGYRYYDLEGIPRELASAILAGETPAERTRATFKLGFGAEVIEFPRARLLLFNPVLRQLYKTQRRLGDLPFVQGAFDPIKRRGERLLQYFSQR